MTTEPLLDKPECAQRLKISIRTLDGWIAKRIIPFLRIGRTVRFKWSEVMEAMAEK